MNSQIVKKESLIWIFLLLESYALFMNSHFENRTARWGTVFATYFYSTEKREFPNK